MYNSAPQFISVLLRLQVLQIQLNLDPQTLEYLVSSRFSLMDHALDPSFSVGNDLLHPERSNKSMEKTLSVCLVYLEPEFSFFC